MRQRVGHLDAHGTCHVRDELIGLELVTSYHLDFIGYFGDFAHLIGVIGTAYRLLSPEGGGGEGAQGTEQEASYLHQVE